MSENEMDTIYEFTQKITEAEVGLIIYQMDKKGLVETGVNKEGEIVFKIKK